MKDRDANDYKILGVPNSDSLFNEYRDLHDVPSHFLKEVEHFFATYQGTRRCKDANLGWRPAKDAIAEVQASVERYGKNSGV